MNPDKHALLMGISGVVAAFSLLLAIGALILTLKNRPQKFYCTQVRCTALEDIVIHVGRPVPIGKLDCTCEKFEEEK